ncbi:46140_t:CDS:2 [Gigaspora margarita]|uniref:46140_t:CDS:1 n=1 Tax=Gigaspora margarita TaxID=4874 RepID=A0ABM8W627_GIGMA|nr:46140_t:CDS:2 [Gigaspora margarita]
MGLPCSHIISEHLAANQALQKSLVQRYQFWLPHQQDTPFQLEELVNTLPIVKENPVTRKPLGRPIGTKKQNKRTTHRDPSAFEHVEKWSRQYSTCYQTSHNT